MRRLLLLIGFCFLLSSCREIVEKEADEKLALAETALREEQWSVADESFHEAILLDPDRADAWIGRGMTLTRLDEKESARKHYEEALAIYERRLLEEETPAPEAIRRQIMLLVLLDRREEAAALAREAAENHPDEELVRALPELVETIQREFQEMILLREEDEEIAPILKSERTASTP